jgi:hypothetical protein
MAIRIGKLVGWMTGEEDQRRVSNEWLAYNAFRNNIMHICGFMEEQRRGERLIETQNSLTATLLEMSLGATELLEQQTRTQRVVEGVHEGVEFAQSKLATLAETNAALLNSTKDALTSVAGQVDTFPLR